MRKREGRGQSVVVVIVLLFIVVLAFLFTFKEVLYQKVFLKERAPPGKSDEISKIPRDKVYLSNGNAIVTKPSDSLANEFYWQGMERKLDVSYVSSRIGSSSKLLGITVY